ncbi:HEAT repeat domain-containing protein [Halospeciosus flavus]|uniref:HEAT repeat domain-containing protein n=1 Tax=Halospeciosus flavus TaxID=3032283 RepID=A0ABD5Z4J6_9EURY|nr:HEAT repeat domain-containing protein [Halospeciosus flavus]
MSDGDEESEPETETEPGVDETETPESASESESTEESTDSGPVEAFDHRLDEAESALDAAETEADLDEVEATLDEIESDLEAADLPEPEAPEGEEEEAEVEDPREQLEGRLSDLRDDLEDQRGPYAEDVAEGIREAASTVEDTRWTEAGAEDVAAAVEAFLDTVETETGVSVSADGADPDALEKAADEVESAGLDADEDAETIQTLLDAITTLEGGLDEAQEWSDLSMRERLRREGFYEPIEGNKHKDYPPEWSALKEWQKRDNAEMVILLLDTMNSEHLERHALDALVHMGNEDALDALAQRANKRDISAIEAIGNVGSEEGVEAVRDYSDSASNPELQKEALKSLGKIGDTDTTEDVAVELAAENEGVRSQAARSLGLVGDTRAIDPLADVLADEDESDNVRASAAWALVQIGTERALREAAEYADHHSFLVQKEAEQAAEALDRDAVPA